MDSLTQIALGAAVGEAVLGRRVGRKAALWGAVCGTLPDLDVLVPMVDPVASFTYHRSFSHSLIMMALATPLIVWLIRKIHPGDASHLKGWTVLVYLTLATHALLDSCTIYGTQIFWPLTELPMTWGSLFIIDPVYTVPLLVGLVAVAVCRNNQLLGFRINLAMLAISTLYLTWSFGAKYHAQSIAHEALAEQGMAADRVLTLASPFNTILWRYVVMHDSGYSTGWYSLLDSDRNIKFTQQESQPELLAGIEEHWPVSRLQWFTKGFYSVTRENDDIVISDLRMGVEGAYVFRFKVGEIGNPHARPLPAENRGQSPDLSLLPDLWKRLKGQKNGLDCCT